MRLVLTCALLLLLGAGVAMAHSELRQSDPAQGAVLTASPDQISLTFNERVQVTAIRLYTEAGKEIALARVPISENAVQRRSLPPLSAGSYRVEWRAISADGHPVGGNVRFRVAVP